MPANPVVTHDEWIEARKELLAKEKELSKLRDEMTRLRQDLPWEKVDKDYAFAGPDGKVTLSELFGDRLATILEELNARLAA